MYKNNLWRAILALFNSSSIISFLINLDRLGNAIAAGDYRTTVSGRVGYFALTKQNKYWLLLERIIDFTFKPIDNKQHCFKAFVIESKQGLSHRRGNDIALALLSAFTILGCLILAPIIWLLAVLK